MANETEAGKATSDSQQGQPWIPTVEERVGYLKEARRSVMAGLDDVKRLESALCRRPGGAGADDPLEDDHQGLETELSLASSSVTHNAWRLWKIGTAALREVEVLKVELATLKAPKQN